MGNTGFNRDRILHFDGASWTEVLTTESSSGLDRIAGAQGRIYAAGFPELLYTYP